MDLPSTKSQELDEAFEPIRISSRINFVKES